MTTQTVGSDHQSGLTEQDNSMGVMLGVMAPLLVVIVMFVILLFSFYKFHKRLHHKKKHHVDYIRANLPLKRPRISPPNMNTFNALDSKSCPSSVKGSKTFNSSVAYKSLPKEDAYSELETDYLDSGYLVDPDDCRVTITDNLELMSSKVKRTFGARWKSGDKFDKFDKYCFELVPTICQPESDYLPGDELFGKYINR